MSEQPQEQHELTSVRHSGQLLLWLVLALLSLGAVISYAVYYRQGQADADRLASQRQDYALCVVQNENRASTRLNATVIYSLISSVLRQGGPMDPDTEKVFRRQLKILTSQIDALKPIKCATYVRPDIPPDKGVS